MIHIHACPAILPEVERAATALARDDVIVESLCGGPEAATCVLRAVPPDDELHIVAGSCPGQSGRLPPHLHVVDWLTCFEALAGSRDIDRWLDEGAHLLTPGMLQSDGPPVWRRWGFRHVSDAADFAQDGMTRLIYLDTGEDPGCLKAAQELAADFGLPLQVQPTDLDRLTLWLRGAIRDAENARDLRHMRRLNSEQLIVSNIMSRMLETDTLADALSDVQSDLSVMTGATVEIDLDATRHMASSAPGIDTEKVLTSIQERGAEIVETEAGFRVRLMYGPCPVGEIAVSDVQFTDRRDEYRDTLIRLAPSFVVAAVAHFRRQRNRKNEILLAEIFRNSPSGILLLDFDGAILRANGAALDLLGADEDTLSGMRLDAFDPHDLKGESQDPIARMQRVDFIRDRFEIRRVDGAHRLVTLVLRKTNFRGDGAPKIIAILNDVGERIALERSMRKAQAVFDATSEGIAVTDSDAIILDVNQSFTKITGYTRAEVVGGSPSLLKSGVHDAEFYRTLWHSLTTQGFWRGQIWNRRKSGEIYPELLSINALKDETGENFGYVAAFSDITSIKRSEDELRHLAFHDTLTDLPNRIQLRSDLQRNINLLEATDGALAVLFVDLDGFKCVNDSFGHQVGDELLKSVAQLLKSLIRRSDTAARIGGDEFILLVTDLPASGAADYARTVVEKIIRSFEKPFDVRGRDVRVTCSIGVSLYPHHGSDVSVLMKMADDALYKAKEAGRNTFRFAPA